MENNFAKLADDDALGRRLQDAKLKTPRSQAPRSKKSPKSSDADEAGQIISKVTNVVSDWRALATDMKISRNEQQMVSLAFRVAEEWQ